MKNVILIELAKRWDRDAKPIARPAVVEDSSESAKEKNAIARGYRECKRECADTLRILIKMLGDE